MIPSHGSETGGARARSITTSPTPSSIDGLWVLLTANDGELSVQDAEGRVPVLARASNDKTYLLVFKNVVRAKAFIVAQSLELTEPRMIVRGNKDEIIRIAKAGTCAGALLDFEASTGAFASIFPLT